MSPSAVFAQALGSLEGVGRVTAGRLLSHFASYDHLLKYPREQVLARVKGAPRAEDLVTRLFDEPAMRARLAEAEAALHQLAQQRVAVLTCRDAGWPAGIDDLPRSSRPPLLYTYGPLSALARPRVAFFARPPLGSESFEQAQALVRHLLPHGVVPVTGAGHGFDVVVHKIAGGARPSAPSLLVLATGLARLAPPLRPTATAVVRAGGMMLSSFDMNHGPYEHDEKERSLLQAALAGACVFLEPHPDAPEWAALTWALEAGRPVFGLAAPDAALPERVHRLRSTVDFEWVVTALNVTP